MTDSTVNRWDGTWGIALLDDFPEHVRFLDTTLRDGEQTPGIALTPTKKLQIARKLDQLGVDVIEAGFAAVSDGELQAVKLIASEDMEAEICSAARGVKGDIDAAIDAGVDSVNIIIPTSDLHIKRKLGKGREDVLDMMAEAVDHVKTHGLVAELSTEDGSRTEPSFLKQVIGTGLEHGLDRATLCDTVGILTPERACALFRDLRTEFPDAVIGVHCHDDFGLAVANSLAALRSGADQVHATVNGIGERAGNASLEEVAVALRVMYGVEIGVRTEMLHDASQLVSRLTGVIVQPNKAIVGENAFAHESGIHTHAVLKDPLTYEPIRPEMVGAVRRIVSGKHSGSHGIRKSLQDMGLNPDERQFTEIVQQVKGLGDGGKRITDADLFDIGQRAMGLQVEAPLKMEEFTVVTGNKITPTASVKLTLDGDTFLEAATGDGPVDATLNAVTKAIHPGQRAHLDTYHVEAITGGTDAVVNVEVRLRRDGRIVTSTGVSEDIVMASVDAFLRSMNVLLAQDRQLKQREMAKPYRGD
jgi:isopropylmalate/citramalate/homocitrate synthase-like protein